MSKSKTNNYITLRSHVAIAAHFKTGGGKHGGSDRQNNRRDRKAAKQALKSQI